MTKTDLVAGIFGDHRMRSAAEDGIRIRDRGFIADLQARLSGLAAEDNARREAGWSIAFSPIRVDALTERSLFDATFASDRYGEHRLALAVARDWVGIGGDAMESSVRGTIRNLEGALVNAFRRAVLGGSLVTEGPIGAGAAVVAEA